MDLTNQFLIAMPSLADPNFHRTVTLMCAHSEDGAMGIVINRPLDIKLTAVLDQMSIELTSNDAEQIPVLQGGPVQRERGFVIHHPPGDWDAVLRVGDDIGISTSKDILSAVAEGRGSGTRDHRARLRRVGSRAARARGAAERLAERAGGLSDHLRYPLRRTMDVGDAPARHRSGPSVG